MKLLEGKTAIITGASRGIGKSIAIEFAKQGCNIAFTDLEYNDLAKETEKEISEIGVKVKAYASDASKFDKTQEVVKEILNDFGSVDILINNAGITMDSLLMRMSEKQWDIVIDVNLKSVFNFIKAVQPVMLKNRAGSIINMSSVVGVNGNAGQVNYSASKAGILGVTKSVAKELGSRNIRCNAIAPGFIITEMTAKLKPEVVAEWEKTIPLRRGGTPKDIANACIFLASDMGAYVTGQTLSVDGGM